VRRRAAFPLEPLGPDLADEGFDVVDLRGLLAALAHRLPPAIEAQDLDAVARTREHAAAHLFARPKRLLRPLAGGHLMAHADDPRWVAVGKLAIILRTRGHPDQAAVTPVNL
jgi:hypothetical protein